jgi:hypothetical protein
MKTNEITINSSDCEMYERALRWAINRICFLDPEEIRKDEKSHLSELNFLADQFKNSIV